MRSGRPARRKARRPGPYTIFTGLSSRIRLFSPQKLRPGTVLTRPGPKSHQNHWSYGLLQPNAQTRYGLVTGLLQQDVQQEVRLYQLTHNRTVHTHRRSVLTRHEITCRCRCVCCNSFTDQHTHTPPTTDPPESARRLITLIIIILITPKRTATPRTCVRTQASKDAGLQSPRLQSESQTRRREVLRSFRTVGDQHAKVGVCVRPWPLQHTIAARCVDHCQTHHAQ